ncbi:MAG: hypothetical protein Q8N76_02460 [Candidatus Omnitrophota bacterium]|nr:hypothetical protein [Candidatus Omnitrophota bacterium]
MALKNIAVLVCVAVVLLCAAPGNSLAATAEIRNVMKAQRAGSYVIVINYETYKNWTDNLVFKVICKFNEGEFTFTSASLNNIKQGWHKTEIEIPEIMKKRYGSLREYRIELYCKGTLIGLKSSY